jgi:DNA-directed RNA polymerase III subunit RPC1
VRLPLPCFHIGYIGFTRRILEQICKDCSKILLSEDKKRSFLLTLRRPLDNLKRTALLQEIRKDCMKTKTCYSCGSINGEIKKAGVLKLVHDKYNAYNKSTSLKKVAPESKIKFDNSFSQATLHNPELEKHLRKTYEDLNPLYVINLFKRMSHDDCELVGINSTEGRPELFIWQYLPAPPICIRPSVAQDDGGTNEDDVTMKLSEIVLFCGYIRLGLQKGAPISQIMELWEYLQTQVAIYVNSDVPGLQQPGFAGKNTRGFCQRLKGKQGRFRGNLSGKRVDFSGRTVISPDPNLGIDQVAVPELVARNLTYPERVQRHNIKKLRDCVLNGPDTWPGAHFVVKTDMSGEKQKFSLKYGDRYHQAKILRIGDVVERHLEDGDVVLFNRQPSLHKLSIMSHIAKVRPWKTFRLNECVCTPYNADFDGDEMNLHLPQTEEARAEAINLMGVKHNLSTPKNGEPIIAATQDFITAAYVLSSKDRFFDRKSFSYICQHMMIGATRFDLPTPTIIKPRELWTGKQIFSILMRPHNGSPVMVNLDAPCKSFKGKEGLDPNMDPNDSWLVVRNSEVLSGVMDKSTVGSGKKDSIFYVILRDFGPDYAAISMNNLARLCARALTNHGFSIGLGDVFPTCVLEEKKHNMVCLAYRRCDDLIEKFKRGKLEKSAGCSMEETLENALSGVLSQVRSEAGDYCIDTLSRNNAPLVMAKSGSKGSVLNVAQMIALVGQQIISGERVPDGFQDRSLPHFHKNARQPPSKGFVKNSFYNGLLPTEFLFHAISGREGLVDTAVKTAETGYMSRRLMKSLEDLSTQYDNTVRTSSGSVVQFQFGADNLDPVDMEGKAVPVNFVRTWNHAANITWSNYELSLNAEDIRRLARDTLNKVRATYQRYGLARGELLRYDDTSDYAIDEHEGARRFLDAVESFVEILASKNESVRKRLEISTPKMDSADDSPSDAHRISGMALVDRVAKVSASTLTKFINLCLSKYETARVEPGHAVGAVGAQSIGEPGTQMTLKTFHFAGVASGMSVTQGVPRIKEIINASKLISTPVIICPLLNSTQAEAARIVKARIEKAFISDVLDHIEDEWCSDSGRVTLRIDRKALNEMHLGIKVVDIAGSIVRARKTLGVDSSDITVDRDRIEIRIKDGASGNNFRRLPKIRTKSMEAESIDMLRRANFLRREIPGLVISGYPDAARAIIETSREHKHQVSVEGYGLKSCMTTEGVIGTQTTCNSVLEVYAVLGIEAARSTIANEISEVMKEMDIDPRHMQLLADVMTFKGEVLGITRHGLSKMRDSVLQLASFEKTPDHLFDAAAGMKIDEIEGVSECIIMGQPISVGTGACQVARKLGITPWDLAQSTTRFEDAWAAW